MNKHAPFRLHVLDNEALILDIQGFEGPLELLLSLAQDQKVDLREISISELVEQYLDFIKKASGLKIELAAEYLMMAAWLAYLKSKLLLPIEDATQELSGHEMEQFLAFQLQRLVEIKKCAEELFLRPQLGIDFFPRGQVEIREKIIHRKKEAKFLDLLRSYASMNSKKAFAPLKLVRSSILTIDDAFNSIMNFFSTNKNWVTLIDIIPVKWLGSPENAKSAMATTFAASLELVKSGDLEIKQSTAFKPMKIKSIDSEVKT